jgi:hypothetical protein
VIAPDPAERRAFTQRSSETSALSIRVVRKQAASCRAILAAVRFGARTAHPCRAPCATTSTSSVWASRCAQTATTDYTASVLFNAYAAELWRRFVLAFRRRLAKSAGLRTKELRDVLLVSFAKVAEYQRRGVVHFHAVIRSGRLVLVAGQSQAQYSAGGSSNSGCSTR